MSLWDWIFFLPTWLNVLLVVVAVIYVYGVWPYKTSTLKFPGPKPYPFVGTMMPLFTKGVAESDSEDIKKYGDMVLTWTARTPQLLCADPDIIGEINIKQFSKFVNRIITRGRFAMSKVESLQLSILEDDHWKFVRSTLSPAFSSGRLREMVPILQVCQNNLQDIMEDKAKEGQSFDFKKVFEAFTIDAISTTSFGMESCVLKNPDDPFAGLLRKFLKRKIAPLLVLTVIFPFLGRILEKFNISSMPKESQEIIEVISRDVRNNMKQRREQKTTRRDLLQLMMNAQADDVTNSEDLPDSSVLDNQIKKERKHLTEMEVMAQSFLFLIAGYATTSGTLGFLAHLLAINPEEQEKLIDEIDKEVKQETPDYANVMKLPYLDMCLSETLRLYPASGRTTRLAGEDVVIKGHHIPAGMSVNFAVDYLHHSPKYWPEPEKFKPTRFTPEEKAKRNPYVYLPFGLGPRNCVGMRLAQLEAKMAMVSILQKYRFVRSIDTEVPLKMSKVGLAEAANGVWLKVEARHGM